MKKLLLILCLLSCNEDEFEDVYDDPDCVVGNWTCKNNVSMICNEYEWWESYQDCNVTSETCVYNRPDLQGGYYYLSSCEKID